MNIGLYTPNYPGITADGGIGSYVITLGKALAGLGHKVCVLTPGSGPDPDSRPPIDDGPLRVHLCGTSYLPGVDKLIPGAGACWRVDRAVRRLTRAYRLDVLDFANWEGFGLLSARRNRPPVVVRLATSSAETQEIDGSSLGRWDQWNVKRERWQATAARIVVTHSDAHRKLMAAELGVPPERIRLVPLAVDTYPDFVRPQRKPGPMTVVYLGRLEHRKGTVELLQAIPKVLEQAPDTRFVMIGVDRPHAPGGRTHADYLAQDFPPHVRQAVTLAGRLPQPDVDRWLQTADVFVAPSRYESFGLIFVEAMRWGTPVIGTTAGGIPEVVGQSGLLVPPQDPAALAAAMVRLLTDANLRGELGAAGRKRAETEFAAETMARRMTALYQEAIAASR